MRHYSVITPYPQQMAQTPRQFGINVETQEYHETANLWDWIADSGVAIIRDFHPEVNLRRAELPPGTWGTLSTKNDFDTWRQRVLADPTGDAIAWHAYRFDEAVPWLGVPNGIAESLHKIQIECLYSLGYATKFFERPLIKDIAYTGVACDEDIDWEAAASAYDYYFAYIYHFCKQYQAQQFLMINEPENRTGWWHLPEAVEKRGWGETYWDDPDGRYSKEIGDILAAQYTVCARLARMALDDVQALLAIGTPKLYGPTTVFWQPFWQQAQQYLDGLDFHHYHPDAETFRNLWPTVAHHAGDKPVLITEFNRHSGGMSISEGPFNPRTAVETADVLMEIASLSQANDPELAIACFYLLHFPSTHRNHKHLLYGDMNLVDWTGDQALWDRAAECYPTAEELQIRHCAPGYHVFRMLARVMHGGQSWPILRMGMDNPSSSGPADIHDQIGMLTVDQGDRVIVSLLNRRTEKAAGIVVDSQALTGCVDFAVRLSGGKHHDAIVNAGMIPNDGTITLDIPGQSLAQVILWRAPQAATKLTITDISTTPGQLDNLSRYETLRLRSQALVEGTVIDQSEQCIIWESSIPDVIRVSQSGLTQRLRSSSRKVVITATDSLSGTTASVTIPGDIS